MRLIFFLAVLFLAWPDRGGAEPVLKVVNGQVRETRIGQNELVLAYRHPVNGEISELTLKVNPETGFSEGIGLGDLQKNDPISVDYEEIPGSPPQAVQVKRVPVRGIPEEISRRLS